MAKKTRALFAVLLVLVMVFTAACSADDSGSDKDDKKPGNGGSSLSDILGKDDKDDEADESEPTAPSIAIQTIPTEIETEPTEAETEPTEAETEPTETEPTEAETAPVEDVVQLENPGQIIGTVLYNKDGIKVTVTGYKTESFYGPEISVKIENSSDKKVLVSTDLLSVNGYMMEDVLLYADVDAGSEVEDFFLFSNETLAQRGIKEISEVKFYIVVSDPDTYDTFDTSKLLSLNLTESYTRTVDYSGQELYNKDDIQIIFKGVGSDDLFDGLVYFLVKNNSGKNISVYAHEIFINGTKSDDTFWSDVRDGTVNLDSMVLWDLSSLRLTSVDEIETITLTLYVIDYDTWDEIDFTETITITIEK